MRTRSEGSALNMSVSTPSDRETNKHVDQFFRTAMPLEAVSSAAPGAARARWPRCVPLPGISFSACWNISCDGNAGLSHALACPRSLNGQRDRGGV